MAVSQDRLFIGGEWVAPSSGARIAVRSASTEEVIGEVPEAAEADVDAAVAAARRAFDDPAGWSQLEPAKRAAVMERLAVELEARAQQIGDQRAERNADRTVAAHRGHDAGGHPAVHGEPAGQRQG